MAQFETVTIIHAFYAVIMLSAALNAKALGVCFVAAIALHRIGTNIEGAAFVFFIFVPAYLLSTFRN